MAAAALTSNDFDKILSLVASRAASSTGTAAKPTTTGDYRAWTCGLAARLLAHGFAWQDDMAEASALLKSARALPPAALAPAGMGASVLKWKDGSARGDLIGWVPLDSSAAPADSPFHSLCAGESWSHVGELFSGVVDALNREATGQVPRGEQLVVPKKVMLARYPAGARYVRHSDVSPAVANRRVTAILYLNEGWEPGHGGQLLLYPPTEGITATTTVGTEAVVRVAPLLGRLLLFNAAIEHEVAVTQQPRWAVTAWLSVASLDAKPSPPKAAAAAAAPPLAAAAGGDTDMAAILQLAAMMTAPPPKPPAASTSAAQPPSVVQPSDARAAMPTDTPIVTSPAVNTPTSHASAAAPPATDPTSMAAILQLASMATSSASPEPPSATAAAAAVPIAATATLPALSPACALTIFVSIASYRDPEAPHTLHSLFSRAADPSRVVVGVCFQCDETEDADCMDLSGLEPAWRANVRVLRMPWKAAKGPVWARHQIQSQLFDDEDYFLQIDSHTRFAQGWDERLIRMLSRCPSPKPVLTTYPLPYDGTGAGSKCSQEHRTTLLCTREEDKAFGADGMLRFRARLLASQPPAPVPTAFWAAGFSFSSGALVREVPLSTGIDPVLCLAMPAPHAECSHAPDPRLQVPYDPHLPFLFFGEEISIALRMWTRGWDLFAPDAHMVFHLWAERSSYRTTFWEVPGGADLKAASQARVRRLLTGQSLEPAETAAAAAETAAAAATEATTPFGGVAPAATSSPAANSVWGLGRVRSLRMYEELSGVDFAAKRVSPRSERGGLPSEASLWDRFACLHAMLDDDAPKNYAREAAVAVE